MLAFGEGEFSDFLFWPDQAGIYFCRGSYSGMRRDYL